MAARRPATSILSMLGCIVCAVYQCFVFVQPVFHSYAPQRAVPSIKQAAVGNTALVGEDATSSHSFLSVAAGATLLAAAATLSGRSKRYSTACHAKPKRKKGVRVVKGREIPWNIFGPKAPYTATVVDNHTHPQTLTEDTGEPNWETTHITLDHGGNMPYLEGQSIGVIAPGPDKKGETPAKMRLYSIASSAVGDDESSTTVSLCVKRNVQLDSEYANREIGEDQPDKAGTAFPNNRVYRGVCSNFVGDLSAGDEVLITGPTGAEMLLPDDPESNLIMLATGTGIAPMRGYCRRLFHDEVGEAEDGNRIFKGLAWMFLGVPHSQSLLYDEEHKEYKSKFPEQFRYDYAISREQANAEGEKMYLQTRMAEYADELWALMQNPKTHVYMCGLKGMEKGMAEVFGPYAEAKGVDWAAFAKSLKKEGRYHVEVY